MIERLEKYFPYSKLSLNIFSIFFFVFAYRLLLDATFVFYLEPNFAHSNFFIDLDFFNYSLSFLGLTACFFSLNLKMKKSELDSIVWLFSYLVVYVPLCSYYGMTNANSFWFMAVTSAWICCNLFINSNFLSFRFSFPLLNKKWLQWGGVFLGLLIASLIIYKIDINFSMSMTEVYELREKKPTNFIPYSDYMINALSKVVLPLIILLSLYYWRKNSLILLGLSIFVVLIFYFSTGHKGMLFNIPFIMVIYFLMHFKNQYAALSILLFFGVLVIVLYTMINSNNLILSLVYRRTLMTPPQLSFYYHDFFQENYLFLSNSILSDFSHYSYALQPPYEIADYFFDKPEMAASNGLLSDGFRHFGYLGLFLWMFTFVILLKILKGFTANVAFPVMLTMAILFAKTVMDGPLLTTLLTHGFLFLFVLLLILKPKVR